MAAGVASGTLFALCGGPGAPGAKAGDRARLIAFSATGARRLLAQFPADLYVAGATLSPDGRFVAAELAPGCGPPFSYVAPTSGGPARPVSGEGTTSGPKLVASYVYGWTSDERIVAYLSFDPTCEKARESGVYLIDPTTLERELVYASTGAIAMWNPDPELADGN